MFLEMWFEDEVSRNVLYFIALDPRMHEIHV